METKIANAVFNQNKVWLNLVVFDLSMWLDQISDFFL